MKNKIIIANWKMSLPYQETIDLAQKLVAVEDQIPQDVEIIVCPTYVAIPEVIKIFKNTEIKIGAQDVFWEEKGAYTGEISPSDLKTIGCTHTLLGHSERRIHLGETNAMVHNKIKVSLKNGLTPILCIGEDWDQRQGGQRDYTLIKELNEILGGVQLSPGSKMMIAYEPIWAISSGKGIFAEPDEVKYVCEVIRQVLLDLYDLNTIDFSIQLIYGGSVNKLTVHSYTSLPYIKGVLVGNASTKPEEFISLIQSA